jgi:outer membrane protein OmpA-like peptidoglycan-associated protein
MKNVSRVAIAAIIGALAAAPAAAQLSAEEIANRLSRQTTRVPTQSENRGVTVTYGETASTGAVADVSAAPAAPQRSERRVVPASARPDDAPIVDEGDDQVNLRITFESGSAFIRPGQAGVLNALCDALRQLPEDLSYNIIGHADAAGDDRYNLELSRSRAREVRRYLSRECGVDASRLTVYGVGESRPLAGVPAISEQNRRVEIQRNSS